MEPVLKVRDLEQVGWEETARQVAATTQIRYRDAETGAATA
jgi:hypothetical protein